MRRVGQITIKRIGKKYAACISGTPVELFNSFREAEKKVRAIRQKMGRRHYGYSKKRKR